MLTFAVCRSISGSKIFADQPQGGPGVYKFVSMILDSTGGGILVPIMINGIPVPLAQDSYPIAIFCSFLLHSYFPILREVFELSPIVKVSMCIVGDARSDSGLV
jgi:hypothetical protein